MVLALFGIGNDTLNLIVNLLVLALVVIWLALIYWTYVDARRRMKDSMLIGCATAASIFPFVGTVIYAILRPPEYLEDVQERELEIKAAELRVRQLSEQSCSRCKQPIERSYLRCPNCQLRLKDPCPSCSKPLDPRWSMCPYCETPVRGAQEPSRLPAREGRASAGTKSRSDSRPKRPAKRSGSRGARQGTARTAGRTKS